jgi:glycosyltransferase involved in cell wall biosynthesis
MENVSIEPADDDLEENGLMGRRRPDGAVTARVLVDATAVPPDRGGVGRYVDHVVAGLDRLGADLVVACQEGDADVIASLAPSARVHPLPSSARRRPVRMGWEQTGLPVLAARTRSGVLWSPHYTTAMAARLRRVVTLHDATFFSDPGVHLQTKARFFRTATRAAVRVADRCIVPSKATRDEVVRWAGGVPERLEVIPHGVDLARFSPPAPADVTLLAERLGLRAGRYVAFLGTLEPRKNLAALVRGWSEAFSGTPDPPPLVLAGASGWDDQLDSVLAAVPADLHVVRPGYLPLQDLPPLLGGAAVVAYPSLGEGFGLPVLEAMACGAAVLTTRRLALPEVGGDAVAYTEPDDASIAAALRALMADDARRAQLSAAALARARTFTWERSASAHLRVFEEVAR